MKPLAHIQLATVARASEVRQTLTQLTFLEQRAQQLQHVVTTTVQRQQLGQFVREGLPKHRILVWMQESSWASGIENRVAPSPAGVRFFRVEGRAR